MSIFIDAVIRWLLRQPAVRRLIADSVAAQITSELDYAASPSRKAMARITRGEAKDAVQSERERLQMERELSAEYQRHARQERERSLAASDTSGGYESPSDPLTGLWDAPPPPRCQVCSEPIRWLDEQRGGRWIHASGVPAPFHRAGYALADVEQTVVLPVVEG